MQRSTLTYSVDHTVLESRVNAQRSFPCWDLEISYIYYDYKIKVEILNIQIIRSRAQIANGVGAGLAVKNVGINTLVAY